MDIEDRMFIRGCIRVAADVPQPSASSSTEGNVSFAYQSFLSRPEKIEGHEKIERAEGCHEGEKRKK